jgi:hypothetical protein
MFGEQAPAALTPPHTASERAGLLDARADRPFDFSVERPPKDRRREMIKLFGFVKARGDRPARMVRVEATGRMPREELRRKLVAISARKQRSCGAAHDTGKSTRDEQPPSMFRESGVRSQESGIGTISISY